MHLIFNELSLYPIADNEHIIGARFSQFLKTFKEAKNRYGFNHVRFPINFRAQKITTTETFFEWVSNLSNHTVKNLLIDICKNPFTDELEEEELKKFFESNYSIQGNDIPTNDEPVGLPVSHIKSLPSISLYSHQFWLNRKILILKTNANTVENISFTTYNICIETDLYSIEFTEWADKSMPKLIDTIDVLKKYLGYTKYQVFFSEDFMIQFYYWRNNDFEIFKYLLLLMKDVQIHPFTGGMGQTENLRGRGKEASKRITNRYPDGDRLSYFLEKGLVSFVACRGHYDFH